MSSDKTKKRRRPRGEGSVFRSANGQWRARLCYIGPDGRKRTREARFKTQKAALEALNQWKRDLADGLLSRSEGMTLATFLERWLQDCIRPRCRPRTVESYGELIRRHITPGLGAIRLDRLNAADVQRFLNAKLESGLSPRTVQYLHAILRAALNQAKKWNLVRVNVATLADPPRVERREVQPFTPEQAKQLLAAARGDRLEALYVVALALGLRLGEVLGLRWEDVDLERGVLNVRQQLQRVAGRLQLVPLKTARSRRTLPLPVFVLEALRRHKVRQLEERLACGAAWQETGLVFTSAVGTPLEPRNVVRYYHRLLERAGLPHKRFHDLRHSAASLLRAQGVPLADIRDILGHSQISVTMDLYAHIMEEAKREAAARLDALLGPAL